MKMFTAGKYKCGALCKLRQPRQRRPAHLGIGEWCGAILTAAVLAHAAAPDVAAQANGPGQVAVWLDGKLLPAGRALGATVDVRVLSKLSLSATARQLEADIDCDELSPSPCVPDGVGIGFGTHVMGRRDNISWWPYFEAAFGGHRYSDGSDTELFYKIGAGVGWFIGARGLLQLGLEYEWIDADGQLLPGGWIGSEPRSSHRTLGISLSAGIAVR